MKLFFLKALLTREIPEVIFKKEKHFQKLIEAHLESLLGIRLAASQFNLPRDRVYLDSVGVTHDMRPAIIEYKKSPNRSAVMQVMSYRNCLQRHKYEFGELLDDEKFEDIKRKKLKWDKIRLICIAPGFDKHTLETVQGEDFDKKIELIACRYFDSSSLLLEWVAGKQPEKSQTISYSGEGKEKKQVKSDAEKRGNKKEKFSKKDYSVGKYSEEKKKERMLSFVEKSDPVRRRIFDLLCQMIEALAPAGITDFYGEQYIAYKKEGGNFVFVRAYPHKKLIRFSVKLNPDKENLDGRICKEGNIGDKGSILAELSSEEDLKKAFYLIEKAYRER